MGRLGTFKSTIKVMFNPDGFTFKNAADAFYDLALPSLLITLAWKSRGLYDDAKSFLTRAVTHMDVMEKGMTLLLSNHAPHIEAYLRTIAQREEAGDSNVEDNNRVASR